MDSKQFHRRAWALLLLFSIIMGCMGLALYDAQMVQGADYAARSQRKVATVETVGAARGEILDRYGRVLVSNEVVYQVTLDTSLMKENRNTIIADLLSICRDAGVVWSDSLPIATEAPFSFTAQQPYYTTSADEEGNPTQTLTRLGNLAVAMKWLSGDPTDPEKGANVSLPPADQLLNLMCVSFELASPVKSADGTVTGYDYNTESQQEARAIAGVLYELTLRSKSIYQIPYVFAEDVDIAFISKVKERSLTGVNIDATTVRQYHTSYAAHLLGRVGLMSEAEWAKYQELGYGLDETVGKEGVEQAFEAYLRGTSGTRTVERNPDGKVVSAEWQVEPEPGDHVILTLDRDLQIKVEDALAGGIPNLASNETEGASCVVIDINSGEILAAASYPTYHLETYSADYAQNVSNPLKPLFNRAFQGTYAPGSTFKMVTAIAGLEEGAITPTETIRDEGVYKKYKDYQPMCWIYRQYRTTHGPQNVTQAIKNSCNYFFYEVGFRLGIDKLGQYAKMFGLGEQTGVELPDSAGVMAGKKYTESLDLNWNEGSTLAVAIGQESSQFTPLQLANYIATLVNGGTHYSAHLLKAVKSNDYSEVVYTKESEVVDTIEIADVNLDAVKRGMLELTTSGSVATYFRNLDVSVGAKTGSAQVTGNNESNAVFVCFAPYDNPQIALALVVERGGGGTDLGAIAAEILEYYFSSQEIREEITVENTLIR